MRDAIRIPIQVLTENLVPGQATEGLTLAAVWLTDQLSPYIDPSGWQFGTPAAKYLMMSENLGQSTFDSRSWIADVDCEVATGIIVAIGLRLG